MFRVIAILLVGCSGGLEFEGIPGQPVPARFDSWVPSVTASVDDGEPRYLLVDSGAPYTVLDTQAFPDVPEGESEVDLAAFALRFPGYPVLSIDVLPGTGDRWAGLIGADLLHHFTFAIDYRGEQVWLDEDWDGLLPAHPPTAAEAAAPVDLVGTRVLVEAALEDGAPVWLLVDSGATAVTLDPAVVAGLAATDRPRLEGVTVATADGSVSAYFTRVWRLGIAAAEERSVPVLVLEEDALFRAISDEVGRPVAGLLGASFLRSYLAAIDYGGRELHMHRYAEQDHIDAGEFIRVGFTLAPTGAAWEVHDVYPGTDAAAEGLATGDLVATVDGTPLAGLDSTAVDGLFAGRALGEEVAVGVDRGGTIDERLIAIEDLLPPYDMP